MAAFDIANFPDQAVLRLVGTLDDSTASPTVTVTWDSGTIGPYKQVDNTPGNDTLITEMFLTVSANLAETGGSEVMWLTGGAVVSGETRQVSYTATYRGLLNSEATNPPTAGYSRNYSTHKNNALCIPSEVISVKKLNATFTAGTITNTAEAGEDLEALDSVSLHTDGKLYEYHSTNYPNLVGVVDTAYATAATATYTTFGGVSTGHSSLTVGATQYAEDTGTITETSSATTTVLGTSESATTIRIAKTEDPVVEASQAQAEAGTVQGVYMSPLRTKQAIDEFVGTDSVELGEDLSIGDAVKFYDDSGTVKARKPDISTISATEFTSSDTTVHGCVEISRRKFAVIWDDNSDSNYLKCIIATVNEAGDTISYGTAVTVHTNIVSAASVVKLDDDKLGIAFYENTAGKDIYVIAATVSGTVPTFGTAVKAEDSAEVNNAEGISACDAGTDKLAIVYEGTTTTVECVVCTFSGTVPTIGAAVVLANTTDTQAGTPKVAKVTDDKIIVGYADDEGASDVAYVIAATISGTTPTFGTAVQVHTNTDIGVDASAIVMQDSTLGVYVMRDVTGSVFKACPFSLSGTTVTAGTNGDVSSDAITDSSLAVRPGDGQVVMCADNSTDSSVETYEITISSSNSVTISSATVVDDSFAANNVQICPLSENGVFMAYMLSGGGGNDGQCAAAINERPIVAGLAAEAGSSGETKAIALIGNKIDGLSSLTVGSAYYIQSDATTSTGKNDYPIGRAISTTELILSKNP